MVVKGTPTALDFGNRVISTHVQHIAKPRSTKRVIYDMNNTLKSQKTVTPRTQSNNCRTAV